MSLHLQKILIALLLLITAWSAARNLLGTPFTAPQLDFRIYYQYTQTALAGQNPYIDDNPHDAVAGYVYPLFFMLLTIPFTLLPLELAENLWGLLNCVALLGCCLLLLRLLIHHLALSPQHWKKPLPLAIALALLLTFKPVHETLRFGQNDIFVFLMLLAALNLRQQNYHAACGICFAIAVLIKAQPILLLPGLIAALGRRGLLTFAATLLLYLIILTFSGLWHWEWYNWIVKAPLWTQESAATTHSIFRYLAVHVGLPVPQAHRIATCIELALLLCYLTILVIFWHKKSHWLTHAAWACAIVPPISRFMELHHLILLLLPALYLCAATWRTHLILPITHPTPKPVNSAAPQSQPKSAQSVKSAVSSILVAAVSLQLINLGFTLQQITNHQFQPELLYYTALLIFGINFALNFHIIHGAPSGTPHAKDPQNIS